MQVVRVVHVVAAQAPAKWQLQTGPSSGDLPLLEVVQLLQEPPIAAGLCGCPDLVSSSSTRLEPVRVLQRQE
eukprot:CAMPEP_0181231298 /NCGR_PEP_ID=MMETSP1096-20121128/35016_1 /TAXON_ID=156174 ORGANISM="Chrysochromulina ericina, Strain CCMP281" /NCGR_SAMPLE_ID=MMETSP1096 /ASSEMBLY_ACC=CAM_ASM_000453 /LENGTH=71 /DNA_ID=CAMNT_0023325299 /DNA_START=170 /DNA_END=385 /DNA_ORIENTATION=+